jgi:plasmid stabilization system protein ParE
MQVRWTSAAANDLENIANYLFEQTPENAARLIREIYDTPSSLKTSQTVAVRARRRERENW